MKKLCNKWIFLVIFIITVAFNFIYQHFLYNDLSKVESAKLNSKILKNADRLTYDQLAKNGPEQLERLKSLYISSGDLKEGAKIIEIQIDKGFYTSLDKFIELINLNEDMLDFKTAKKYINKSYILMNNAQRLNSILKIGEYELANNNISKSIEETSKAKDLLEIDKNDPSYKYYNNYIDKRLELLYSIENDFNSENPINAYKKIIKSRDIMYSPNVCKFLVKRYEKEFIDVYKTDVYELKELYKQQYDVE